ncbi:hypothetical protein RJ53_07580 [Methanocalculus chunghsingensis]|uniref:Uncharacterized protein n=1 Tax=Methanocalculus chunghsingensis TaxID=156457 RepID=A0A8J7W6Q7_9EURY|nr:hypothetical protein [Methanocalculus chunghsingensis]
MVPFCIDLLLNGNINCIWIYAPDFEAVTEVRGNWFEQCTGICCCLPDEDVSVTFPYPCFRIGSSDNQ